MNFKRIIALLVCLLLSFTAMVPAMAEYQTLQEGDSGKDVLMLKKAMYYLGYFSSLKLSDSYNKVMKERVILLQKNNHLEETGIADPALQELVFSGKAIPAENAPAPTSVPTPAPTPAAPRGTPSLPELTEEHFLPAGEAEFVFADEEDGLWIYKSDSLSVDIRRYTDISENLVWFETEVYASPDSPLTSYLSNSKNPGRKYMSPIDLARNNQVVLGITDDFFGNRWLNNHTTGIVIRNGRIITNRTFSAHKGKFPNLEVLAVFEDGSMKTYLSDAYTAEEYLEMGVTDTFAFGPVLVSEGKPGVHMSDEDYYHYREPRCALGMIEPNHYFILTVKGRCKDSRGVYLPWLSEKMLEKGCVEALNLDGGGTVSLIFMGDLLNASGKNLRNVTSIIGFGQSDQVK